jgi:hypothetical protein
MDEPECSLIVATLITARLLTLVADFEARLQEYRAHGRLRWVRHQQASILVKARSIKTQGYTPITYVIKLAAEVAHHVLAAGSAVVGRGARPDETVAPISVLWMSAAVKGFGRRPIATLRPAQGRRPKPSKEGNRDGGTYGDAARLKLWRFDPSL